MTRSAVVEIFERVSQAPAQTSPASAALLSREVLPFASAGLGATYSLGIIPNPDPVLKFLTFYGDERSYVAMEESEPKLFDAWQHRTTALLSKGTELQLGSSKSPGAKLIHEYGVEALKRIPRWNDVLEKILDGIKWGWRPMQILLDTEGTFRGREAWFASRVIDKPPQKFRFTVDGAMVFTETIFAGTPLVIDGDWLDFGWLICTRGSLSSPYGTALYRKIWFLWFLKNRFIQKFSQGSERSQGLLKVSKRGAANPTKPGQDAGGPTATEMMRELEDVLSVMNTYNVLIELGGWTTEFETNLDFSTGWLATLQYIDAAIQTAIIGETLTSDPQDRGTQALGTVHAGVRADYAVGDAKFLEECVDDLVDKLVRLNFADVEPGDMPRFHSHARTRVNLASVRALYDMGAPIDGDRVAELTATPLNKEPDDGDLVLQVRPGATLAGLLGAPGPSSAPPPPADDEGNTEDDPEDDAPEDE